MIGLTMDNFLYVFRLINVKYLFVKSDYSSVDKYMSDAKFPVRPSDAVSLMSINSINLHFSIAPSMEQRLRMT